MEIIVDPELCTGHGRCNAEAPALYPLDELGFSDLRDRGPFAVPPGSEDDARRGVDACPERAIRIAE